MNKTLALVFFLTLFAASAASLSYSIETDRKDALYSCGDTAVFTVSVKATNGTIRATLDNFGPKQIARTEWDLAKTNVFAISGSLAEPGFLRLKLEPEPKEGTKAWSVGFEPEKIVKGSPTPEDFDAYWADERARLAKEVPLDPQIVRVPERCTKDFEFYRVSFATFSRRVYGYMSVPTDKTKAPYPVDFQVNAAGFGDWTNNADGSKDSIVMRFSVYPFEMDWKWKQSGLKKTYDVMNEEWKRKYACNSYATAGLSVSREAYFFHCVLLGIDRVVDWVAAREDVDPSRIRYEGTSQGGGFGFYLTGLNHRFARAAFYVPAITDTMGSLKGRQSGWPQPVENNAKENRGMVERWAPYFDGANFASRIRCPVRVAVGFSDTTCAPCAVYAAYNEIKVKDKAIVHGIGMTHSCFGHFYDKLGKWTRSNTMTELGNCYVIDTLANIGKYAGLSANMKTACDFIAKGGFEKLAPGKNAIDGDEVFVNNVEASYVVEAERRPEFHHAYFDIHVPLANDEKIGLAKYDESNPGTFSEKDDCGFNDQKVKYFVVKKGEFAICWPGVCAHAPAITTDEPKKSAKLIVKVRK